MRSGRWPAATLLGMVADPMADQLAAMGRGKSYANGEQLLRQGDESTHVVVLLTGVVKVIAESSNGKRSFLAVRIAGDMLGELAATDGQPRTATVESCGNVQCRRIPAVDWQNFLQRHRQVADAVNRILTQRFRVETERRVEFMEHPAPVRIARVLRAFERSYGRDGTLGRELIFQLSQSELAAAADCAEASVRSTLRAMREQGVVETRYRRLILRNPLALDRWPEIA